MVESVLHRCANENITQLQRQLREIGNPDSTTVFKTHVFTRCLTIVPGGRLEPVKTKVRPPLFYSLYKNCKLYRLAFIIREATSLYAHNHGVFTPRDKEDTLIFLSPPQSLTELVTYTALLYLSTQIIPFTSLVGWNQVSGCCQSLFNPQLMHPKTLLLELGFCMLLLENDLFNNFYLTSLYGVLKSVTDKKRKIDVTTD